LKSFVPFKTLWPLPNVLKISVPFQNALWKDTSKPFVCVLQKFEKSGFLQIAFSKSGFMKTYLQSFVKMLYKVSKDFCFKNLKPTSNGSCFQKKTISRGFPVLQKKEKEKKAISFQKENCSKCFVSKTVV
jgi:hypothetical protein